MDFIRIKAIGSMNSFRQSDFHTYHKTLPMPLKTTVAGMFGAALGISPNEVNSVWLKDDKFKMGIIAKNHGKANDLWQIRKYENKQITAYNSGASKSPYKTAVIIRELLYSTEFILYLSFKYASDYQLIYESLLNPKWALSLGREDELILIKEIVYQNFFEVDNLYYKNTVLPFDVNLNKFEIDLNSENLQGINLLKESPIIVNIPISFKYQANKETREPNELKTFSFISDLPIRLKNSKGFWDNETNYAFQTF